MKTELDIFEYHYTRTGVRYSAPEGMHDDAVYALALAHQHYRDLHLSAGREAEGLKTVLAAYEAEPVASPFDWEGWIQTS